MGDVRDDGRVHAPGRLVGRLAGTREEEMIDGLVDRTVTSGPAREARRPAGEVVPNGHLVVAAAVLSTHP